jgi:hypothetical protein
MKKYALLIFSIIFNHYILAQPELIGEAMLKYEEKKYEISLQYFEKAFQDADNQTDFNYYNAACSAALSKNKVKAWKYLDLSFEKGYTEYKHLSQDTDLKILHKDPKWEKLIKEKFDAEERFRKTFEHYTEEDFKKFVPFKRDSLMGYMEFGTKKIIAEAIFLKTQFSISFSLGLEDIKKERLAVQITPNIHAYVGVDEITYDNNVMYDIFKPGDISIDIDEFINFFNENGKWGVKDKKGEVIIAAKYKAKLKTEINNCRLFYVFSENGTDFFYVDENGVEYR